MEQGFRSLRGYSEVVFAATLKTEPSCCPRGGGCRRGDADGNSEQTKKNKTFVFRSLSVPSCPHRQKLRGPGGKGDVWFAELQLRHQKAEHRRILLHDPQSCELGSEGGLQVWQDLGTSWDSGLHWVMLYGK